jgi:hypothetical protein
MCRKADEGVRTPIGLGFKVCIPVRKNAYITVGKGTLGL